MKRPRISGGISKGISGGHIRHFVYTDGETVFLGVRYGAGRFLPEFLDDITCPEAICKQFKNALLFLNKNLEGHKYFLELLKKGRYYFGDGFFIEFV